MSVEIKRQLTLLNQCDKEADDLYHDYSTSCGLLRTAFWLIYIV